MRTRPLADVSGRELRELLRQESEHWSAELFWDYAEVSAAVAAGIERGTLGGAVTCENGRAIAYGYFMRDSGRAVVGSLFAAEGYRGLGHEESLVEHLLWQSQGRERHDRVECQTLFTTAGPEVDGAFGRAGFESRRRAYMVRPLSAPVEPPPLGARLRPLRREDLPTAADIVHRSHRGSFDAALNLTYATPSLCRGFVDTLVLRSGCGRFDPEASFVAETPWGPAGVLLASHLSARNGHVCQVSVSPEAQGSGIGHALLSAALVSFRRQGLAVASLSVTVDNRRAYGLYERLGFRLRREFSAHAWVRPPARIQLPGAVPA